QTMHNGLAPRHLGDVRTLPKTLRHDPGLLLARPSSPPALPGDHLDTTTGVTFLPGIKHGIYHRSTSTDQLMPGCIARKLSDREVEASCRLRSRRRQCSNRPKPPPCCSGPCCRQLENARHQTDQSANLT